MKTELEIVKEGYRADVAETLAAIGGKLTDGMLAEQAAKASTYASTENRSGAFPSSTSKASLHSVGTLPVRRRS